MAWDWVLVVLVVADALSAYWVYRDVSHHSGSNPVLWSVAVFVGNFIGWIGIIFYFLVRDRIVRRSDVVHPRGR